MPVVAPVDPAQMPTVQESDLSQSGDERNGQDTQPVTLAQPTVVSPSPARTRPTPPSPATDHASPLAGSAEVGPESDALSTASEAAAIGAMSAAEAAVRQRAEADYQRAIEDAIARAAWRTDDEDYGNLVRELVRSRKAAGIRMGSLSSDTDGRGGFDGRWAGAAGDRVQPSLGQDRYGVAGYEGLDRTDGSFGAASRLPAGYRTEEAVQAERAQFRGPRPMPAPPPPVGRSPGQGGLGHGGPRQERPGYYGPTIDLDKLWEALPDYDDLPEVEKPFFAKIMEAVFPAASAIQQAAT